jgi:hypothetical protein
LVTVLLLGFEPFVQSLIFVREADVATPISAEAAPSIGRVMSLNISSFESERPFYGWAASHIVKDPLRNGNENEGLWGRPFDPKVFLDPGFTAAVATGMSEGLLSSSTTPTFLCPGGNCTWPLYSTVGFCSKCNDVSDHVEQWDLYENERYLGPGTNFSDRAHHIVIPELDIEMIPINEVSVTSVVAVSARLVPHSQPGHTVSFKDARTLLVVAAYMGVSKEDVKIMSLKRLLTGA